MNAFLLVAASLIPVQTYEWVKTPSGEQISLRTPSGDYLGNYHLKGEHAGKYFRFLGGRFEQTPSTPPIDVPEEHTSALVTQNFGVDKSKIAPGENYWLGGEKVERERVIEQLAKVPDDAGRLRLTVIGPEAERKRVLADFATAPALVAWRDKLVIKDYAPNHWAVSVGFVTTGTPTIYVQRPDGVVLHRQDSYDGPDSLAEALRKTDPNYKPADDKDKRKPDLLPALPGPLKDIPLPAAAVGAAALLVFLRRGRT